MSYKILMTRHASVAGLRDQPPTEMAINGAPNENM